VDGVSLPKAPHLTSYEVRGVHEKDMVSEDYEPLKRRGVKNGSGKMKNSDGFKQSLDLDPILPGGSSNNEKFVLESSSIYIPFLEASVLDDKACKNGTSENMGSRCPESTPTSYEP